MKIKTFQLKRDWIIRSVLFTNGDYRPDTNGKRVVAIDLDPIPRSAHDLTRGRALFVIEDVEGYGCDHTYACCYWVDVAARRMKDDGTNDPAGERICFSVSVGCQDPLEQVELIGQMTHDGCGITYTLPKISP
ncbi:MAG: hypothetical protein AAB554_05550 [Patescibacteria group bacterium]